MRFLLRFEGVNLANVIDDTDQLSVRRGGGLMILNTSSTVLSLLDPAIANRLKPIATGASIGLFEFDATDEGDAAYVQSQVEKTLSTGALPYQTIDTKEGRLPLKYGTFVVDAVTVAKSLPTQQAEQMATAMNRWRQLQQPTLSLDVAGTAGTDLCALDRTSVGNERCDLPEQPNTPISSSAKARLDYGRGARQRFYENELEDFATADPAIAKILAGLKFTNDLKSLSAIRPHSENSRSADVSEVPQRLQDKLAVFYVDGNGFGKKGRDIFHNHDADGYREWSKAVRKHHQFLLAGLIKQTQVEPNWQNHGEIRLETLLWGGDEILWVVPAWKGWEVARWFFDQKHSVTVHEKNYPLTYGCGLVFCHAKAPIRRVMDLAMSLGNLAKPAKEDIEAHRLAYEVLESFDDVAGDLETHRQRFLPANHSVKELVLDPAALSTHRHLLHNVASSSEFPRRQLYKLVREWRTGNSFADSQKRVDQAVRDLSDKNGMGTMALDPEAIDRNVACFKNDFGDPIVWLHLLQITPYLHDFFSTPSTVIGGVS